MLPWISLGISVAGAAVAVVAVGSNYRFQTREALSDLLTRFEEGDLHVVIWRMEQYTREPLGQDPPTFSLDPIDVEERKTLLDEDQRHLFEQALSRDDSSLRADLLQAYFFGLQVHAWLSPWNERLGRVGVLHNERKTRLLNDTFGYQLATTFLDHWIVANRLRTSTRHDSYFAEQFGFFDGSYRNLVRLLYEDLHSRSSLHEAVRRAIDKRWESLKRDGFRPPGSSSSDESYWLIEPSTARSK